jgi:hypothetical protein
MIGATGATDMAQALSLRERHWRITEMAVGELAASTTAFALHRIESGCAVILEVAILDDASTLAVSALVSMMQRSCFLQRPHLIA